MQKQKSEKELQAQKHQSEKHLLQQGERHMLQEAEKLRKDAEEREAALQEKLNSMQDFISRSLPAASQHLAEAALTLTMQAAQHLDRGEGALPLSQSSAACLAPRSQAGVSGVTPQASTPAPPAPPPKPRREEKLTASALARRGSLGTQLASTLKKSRSKAALVAPVREEQPT